MKALVLGGSGLVGSRFLELKSGVSELVSPSHQDFDLLDFEKYSEVIKQINPEVIVNFAAFTNVDKAEEEKDDTEGVVYKLNVLVPKKLSVISRELGIRFIHLSTDYVFDGMKSNSPYIEEDLTNPLSWYAKTKDLGEKEICEVGVNYAIVRIEMPFSVKFDKKKDIARTFLGLLKEGNEIIAINDQKITPTFVDYGVEAISLLFGQNTEGIFHIASTNHTSPYEFAKIIAREFNLSEDLIKPISFEKFSNTRPAKRPRDSWLCVEKFEKQFGRNILKTIEESIKEFKTNLHNS